VHVLQVTSHMSDIQNMSFPLIFRDTWAERAVPGPTFARAVSSCPQDHDDLDDPHLIADAVPPLSRVHERQRGLAVVTGQEVSPRLR